MYGPPPDSLNALIPLLAIPIGYYFIYLRPRWAKARQAREESHRLDVDEGTESD
jgi:preprotein translocase subunit YajC